MPEHKLSTLAVGKGHWNGYVELNDYDEFEDPWAWSLGDATSDITTTTYDHHKFAKPQRVLSAHSQTSYAPSIPPPPSRTTSRAPSARGVRTPRMGTPRIGSARSMCTDRADGEMILPKTFLTRRGALMLFTAPEKVVPGLTAEEANFIRQRLQTMDFNDVGRKVNSLKDLFDKILSFGETEQGTKIMMKFMRGLDERALDITTQPGGDFTSYVKDVKSRTSSRPQTTQSTVHFDSSVDLQDSLWTLDRELGQKREYLSVDYSLDGRPVSQGRQVLSSEKLAASLRSISRPQTADSPLQERDDLSLPARAVSAAGARRPTSSRPGQDGRPYRKRSSARRPRMSPTPEVLAADGAGAGDEVGISVSITAGDRLLHRPQSSRPVLDRSQSQSSGRSGSAHSIRSVDGRGDEQPEILDDDRDYISEEGDQNEYRGEFIPYDGDVEDEIYDDEGDWSADDADHVTDRIGVSVAYSGSVLRRSGSAPRTFSIADTLPQSRDDLDDVTIVDGDVTQMLPHKDTLMEQLRPQFSDEEIDSLSEVKQPPPPCSPRSLSAESLTPRTQDLSVTTHDLSVTDLDGGVVTQEESVRIDDGLEDNSSSAMDVDSSSLKLEDSKKSFQSETLNLESSLLIDTTLDTADLTSSHDVTSSHYDVTSDVMDQFRAESRKSGSRGSSATSAKIGSGKGSRPSSSRHSRPPSSKKSSRRDSKSSLTSKTPLEPDVAEAEPDIAEPEPEEPKVYERRPSFDLDALKAKGGLIGRRDSQLKLDAQAEHDGSHGTKLPIAPEPSFDDLMGEVSAMKERKHKIKEHEKELKRRKSQEDLAARRTSISQAKKLPRTEEVATEEETKEETPKAPVRRLSSSKTRPPPLASYIKKRPTRPASHPAPAPKPVVAEKAPSPEEEDKLTVEGDDSSDVAFGEKGDEGMTIEELELEKKILEAKMKTAEENLDQTDGSAGTPKLTRKASQRKVVPKKTGKKSGGKNREPTPEEELERQRTALKEQKKAEKMRRLEEAMAMQAKIREKEEKKKKELQVAEDKRREVEDQMADLAREANTAEELEEDVRVQMAAARAQAREERLRKQRDEVERRKREAKARRQRERDMVDAAREREIEMLEGIMDKDAKKKMWEEEKARQAEADRLYEEKLEEDLINLAQLQEDEEQKILQIELQTEEETLARIRQERDEADARRRRLMVEAEQLAEEEEKRRQALLEEQMKVAEERRKQLDEERRKQKEEKQRLMQLHAMEEAARERLRIQAELRRQALIRRRENNLEAKNNLDGMRHSQETTRPWVFSYYILWPRSSYERPMGGDGDKRPKTGASKRSSSKASSKPRSAPVRA